VPRWPTIAQPRSSLESEEDSGEERSRMSFSRDFPLKNEVKGVSGLADASDVKSPTEVDSANPGPAGVCCGEGGVRGNGPTQHMGTES
jgi:hypothetical protein